MLLGLEKRDLARWGSFEVCAYHKNCTDGIAAAAVVALASRLEWMPMPEFVPVQYGEPLPDRILAGSQLAGKGRILFVDFCPEREQLATLSDWADWVAIDHHKHRDWLPVEFPAHGVFDLARSGAMLTWDWFFPGKRAPQLLAYIQDRDLWQWRLGPESREISAGLAEEPRDDVQHWLDLILRCPTDWQNDGRVLLKALSRHVKSLARKAFWVGSDYDRFLAVNATEHVSEVGEEILALYPEAEVACAFFQADHEKVQLCFRSRSHNPGPINALGMAKYFGGGGHTHAAGARMHQPAWSHYLEIMATPVQQAEANPNG